MQDITALMLMGAVVGYLAVVTGSFLATLYWLSADSRRQIEIESPSNIASDSASDREGEIDSDITGHVTVSI